MKAFRKSDMLQARYCFATTTLCSYTHFLLVGGALSSHDHSDQVDLYDIETNKWEKMPSLNEPKFSPTVITVDA